MKYLSVCSGIEAATSAWHHLGWEPVAFSEIEPFPSAVLKHHYPDVPNWGDMTKYQTWPDATINLLVGGTPCQSFSIAGLRKGLEDPRGNLMLTFLGIAQRYRPKYIVWENVPGVLSSNGGRDFGTFLAALGELGYGWAYRVLDAQWFGVAQRRRRVFVVGCLGDQRAAAEVLFESESVSRNPAPSREKRQATSGATKESIGGGSQWTSPNGKDLVGALRARDYKGIGNDDLSEGRGLAISSWWDGGQTSATITTRSGGQYMPDKDNFQAVIQPTIIDRAAFNQGENAQYEPRIEKDETMSSLVAKGPHAIAVSTKQQSLNCSDDVANSISANDYKEPQAVAHAFKIRGGCEGGGKGYLGSDDTAFTVATHQDQQIAQPVVVSPSITTCKGSRGGSSIEAIEEITAIHLAQNQQQPGQGFTVATHQDQQIAQPLAVDTFNQTINEYTTQTLGSSATDVNHYGAVINPPMAIRRLTPIECERLQGFPDNWTQIPWKKKPAEECPDGPRYKALGNSMAVPVMRWIGERINKQPC